MTVEVEDQQQVPEVAPGGQEDVSGGEKNGQPNGPDVAQLLEELGVEVTEDGKIDPKDHVALYQAMRALREQVRGHEESTRKAAEKARLEAMSEQERAVEEARKAGYEEALAQQREVVLRTQVVAAASAAGFADPDDALRYLDVASLTDEKAVRKAVAELAEGKQYLLKAAAEPPKLEQGARGTVKPGADGGDWLGSVLRRRT